jgi:hypothetical protein
METTVSKREAKLDQKSPAKPESIQIEFSDEHLEDISGGKLPGK